jgi:GNAT superfamily N-acetyltransferase
MRYRDRPYDDDAGDFERLWRFLVKDYGDRGGEFRWTVGRMADWKYNLGRPRKYAPAFLSKSAQLWFDDFGDLVAFAINENLDHEIAVFTKRGYGHLFGHALERSVERWTAWAQPWTPETASPTDGPAPRRELVVYIAESDHLEAAYLQAHGWLDLGRASTTRRFDVAAGAAGGVELPDGFRFVTLAEDPNFASKIRLHHDAWSDGAPVTELSLDLHEYSRTAPTYEPELYISVVAPNGEHVAGCTAFPDYESSYAEIERVCTRSDYRRRGLATAALQGCFRALHEVGLETAYLTGFGDDAVDLYRKLGPVAEWHSHAWRLLIPAPTAAGSSTTG